MEKDYVYLTFKTDIKTHYFIKTFAKILGKTQPELINEIIKTHIESTLNEIEDKLKETQPK